MNKLLAEFIGTFWLVLGGMAYAIGHISGCHLNPAVSLGLAVGGRFSFSELPGYVIAQVLGGVLAAFVLSTIAGGAPDYEGGLASNGMGSASPGGYSITSGVLTEVVMTFMFLLIILGATSSRAPAGFAPIAIGLGLTLIHLISIPVTNTSVNPARSTGPAILEGGIYLQQLWLFWVAPLVGVDSALCNAFILFKDKAKPRAKEVYCKGLKLSNLVTSSVIN